MWVGPMRTPLKQLQMSVNWVEGREKNDPRESELVLWPQRAFWMCPFTGQEVAALGQQEGELYQSIKKRPSIPRSMSVLYWNVRGMGRPSFKTNFRHLIVTHGPDVVVLAETWVTREHTEHIIKNLPFSKWYLVDPVGFAGGILILWNPARVRIHITGTSNQGVHSLVEGALAKA
ncbi:uncharacterized protein LOC125492618 [Beta vulgaris subsp. vulgaris]|uniref:uncharacterized protein LOC125492618 n=1 Tax=Beta vulgaris subsp. vulgaris TaxID=3555 RepID=UPI0020369655|nr:uncharacterized protein LOC125492618 [Beta vulgaris subsp. vulgaris]